EGSGRAPAPPAPRRDRQGRALRRAPLAGVPRARDLRRPALGRLGVTARVPCYAQARGARRLRGGRARRGGRAGAPAALASPAAALPRRHEREDPRRAMTTARARPEDFLELVRRAKRGRLKLYIGFAAGVGKTYRMLEEAHALTKRGVDCVIGLVETHGRAETAELIAGVEVVARRRVAYRGVSVEEMDLDAILARRPEVAIVDEIAHTNAPGSRNRKRYQDVLELLTAGINVIGARNVQHLQRLNDLVERLTHVAVRETIPDSFLKQADQVVSLDLSVEDLVERLRAGKIYAPEKINSALENFFTPQNLS